MCKCSGWAWIQTPVRDKGFPRASPFPHVRQRAWQLCFLAAGPETTTAGFKAEGVEAGSSSGGWLSPEGAQVGTLTGSVGSPPREKWPVPSAHGQLLGLSGQGAGDVCVLRTRIHRQAGAVLPGLQDAHSGCGGLCGRLLPLFQAWTPGLG
jgi:hypothetical protein